MEQVWRLESFVEVAGIEPAGAGESTPVGKRGSSHLAEALIKMLTNLTDWVCRKLAVKPVALLLS